jgi:hypothetical protein
MTVGISNSPYSGPGWRLDPRVGYMANVMNAERRLNEPLIKSRQARAIRLRLPEWINIWKVQKELSERAEWFHGTGEGEYWYRPVNIPLLYVSSGRDYLYYVTVEGPVVERTRTCSPDSAISECGWSNPFYSYGQADRILMEREERVEERMLRAKRLLGLPEDYEIPSSVRRRAYRM